MEYLCPNCSSKMIYDAERGVWYCKKCGAEFTVLPTPDELDIIFGPCSR